MGNTIERNITEMTLDPRGFKAGVTQTLDYISSLKKALSFTNGIQNMAELDRASGKIKFEAMASGIDAISNRFNTMGVIGMTVIQNLTNTVIDNAKKMFKQLAMDPLLGGLAEYETQMGAIQTILANTASKGSTLKDVNAALDELNNYADRTIYNFTNMTDSIGKFTTAGVALDTSVSAIKGIANLAAVSGSSSVQASTAMYQLSQAISTGTLKLQDWNSVVNAGMGGEIFQEALKQTARVHGVAVDNFIKQDGSFRESLQRGWITADILLETLSQFTGDLSNAQLEALGYTQEQIVEIQKTAQLANDAATKIKTLTQLKDTMVEALGSGWATTWRLIIGDFEQAKELFGELGDIFGGIIEASSESRNSLLESWGVWGGRDRLISAFISLIKTAIRVSGIASASFKAVFEPLDRIDFIRLTDRFSYFIKSLKIGTYTGMKIRAVFDGLVAILDIVRLAVVAVGTRTADFISKFAPAGGEVLDFAVKIGKMISGFRDFLVYTDFFDTAIDTLLEKLEPIVGFIKKFVHEIQALHVVQVVLAYFRDAELSDFMELLGYGIRIVKLFGSAMRGIFPSGEASPIRAVTKDFTALVEKLKPSRESLDKFYRVFRGIISAVDIGRMFFVAVGEAIFGAFKGLEIGNTGILDFAANLGDSIYELRNFIKQSGFFDGVMLAIGEGIGRVVDSIKKLNPVLQWFVEKVPVVRALFTKLWEVIKQLKDSFNLSFSGPNIMDFFKSFSSEDTSGVAELTGDLDEMMESVEKASNGLGILGWLAEALGPTFAAVGLNAKEWIADFINNLAEGDVNVNFDFSWLTAALNAGFVFAVLATVKKAKKFFDGMFAGGWLTNILDRYVGGDSPLVKSITGTFGALQDSLVAWQNNIKVDMLLKIAAAIAIITVSIVALSMIKPEKLATAVGAISLMMAELFGGTGLLSKMSLTNVATTSASILALSTSLLIMAGALAALSRIKGDELKATLAYVGLALSELVIAIKVMGTGSSSNTLEAAASLVIMSGALLLLSKAILKFGTMDPDTMEAGLTSIGAALVGFVAFTKLIKGNKIIEISLGLGAMALGLNELGDSIKNMASMSWEEILRGLTTMGVALGILAIAVRLMQGAMAGAAAIVVVSLGVIILSKALTMLGSLELNQLLIALAGLAGMFVILGVAGILIGPLVPVLLGLGAALGLIGLGALGVGVGLFLAATGLVALAAAGAGVATVIGLVATALIEVLPKAAAALAEGIVNFIETIANNAGRLLKAAKTLILTMVQAFTETTPAIIVAVFDMVQAILDTILERAPEMLETGFEILIAFLDGIANNIQEVTTKAILVVTEFIKGLEAGIPQFIEAAFSLMVAFGTAIADAIAEYGPGWVQSMWQVASDLIDGMLAGVRDGISRLKEALNELGLAALRAIMDALGISSPSKKARQIFRWLTDGAVLGVRDGTGGLVKEMVTMAEKAQNGMNSVIAAIDTSIKNGIDYVPVITPVLDLTNFDAGVRGMRTSFVGADIVARLSADRTGSKEQSNDISGVDTKQIQYIQNNYSPKALTTSEIYRQTNMQLGRLNPKGSV